MRKVVAAALFCLTVVSAGARPDDGPRAWHWPKEKSFKDGPLVYSVGYVGGEQGERPWSMTFKVKNAGDAGLTRAEAFARWAGVTATDDVGTKIVVTRSAASAGDFPPGRTGEYGLSLHGRPDKKAKEFRLDFAAVEGRPALRLVIPAAKVRDLKATN